jgi:predicted ATPase
VSLNATDVDVDAVTFQTLATDDSTIAMERAVALYRGDFLAGLDVREPLFEEWLRGERERLHELALEVLAKLLARQMPRKAVAQSIQTALRLLTLDPLQEATHRALMRLYARDGRQAAALHQYQLCLDVLHRELGVEPEDATRRLYQTILDTRQLEEINVEPISLGATIVRRGDGILDDRTTPSLEAPFVGREEELRQLIGALSETWRGRGSVAALIGQAGIGKTRLIEKLSARASQDGGLVLIGRASASAQLLPFGPWIEIIRDATPPDGEVLAALDPSFRAELAPLVPKLATGSPHGSALSGPQVHLFETVTDFLTRLASRRPLLLVFEDLQWADESSLRLLSFVSRHLDAAPLLIVATTRDPTPSSMLAEVLNELQREDRLRIVPLAPLAPAERLALLRALAIPGARAMSTTEEERVCEGSRGNPFIIIEMLRAFQDDAMLDPAGIVELPASIDGVMSKRLSHLSEAGRSLVAVASLVERPCDFLLLQAAARLTIREAAVGTEELVRRRIFQGAGDRFAFTHERVSDVAQTQLSTSERRRLHGQIANAIERVHADALRQHDAELGVHYSKSGAWSTAAAHFRGAANRAIAQSACAEAVELFDRARDATAHRTGTDDAHSGERKTVTVLAADLMVIGAANQLTSSRLGTPLHRCLEVLVRNIQRYEGTIDELHRNGIVALFGAPIAHEDHAIRALEAAVTIHDELETCCAAIARSGVAVRARIGIHTGTMAIRQVGDTLLAASAADGETSNVAAALQQIATPTTTFVGDATYRLAEHAFLWRPSAAPLEAHVGVNSYQLLGRRLVQRRFDIRAQRGLTRFIGRDDELQTLLGRWEDAKRRCGQVVSVVGEAGLGKSRLIHEFKLRLTHERALVLEGSCFSHGDVISYLPFLEVLKSYFGLEGVNEYQGRQQIIERLGDLSVDRDAVEPYLHHLLAYRVEDESVGRLPTHLLRERIVAALKTLVLAIAARWSLVVIVEDVHWIDKATEEVIGALVDAMSEIPLLLMLVYRPEYLHAWASKAYHVRIALVRLPDASSAEMVRAILHKPYASKVPLPRLTADQSRRLIEDLLGTPRVARDLVELVTSRAEGNPFFVEELTRSLLDSGDVVQEDAGYGLRRSADALALPATVQGVLLARIDRLTNELREILHAAAVVGRVFIYPILHAVLQGKPDLNDLLAQLQDLEFIYITSLSPHREYSFKHVLTQQAVYDGLLPAFKAELHERVGHTIEALWGDRLEEVYELLAHHYAKSRNADQAVHYLAKASKKATQMNAMVEAKGFFLDAMRLLDTLPATRTQNRRRVALIADQFLSFFLLYQMEEYYTYLTRFKPLARELEEPSLLGTYYASMACCEWSLGEFDRAIQTNRQAIELREKAGNLGELLSFAVTIWAHMDTGNFEVARSYEADVERASAKSTDVRSYVYCRGGLSISCANEGRFERALEIARDVFQRAEEIADRSAMSYAAWLMAWAYIAKGDVSQGLDVAMQAAHLAPTPADQSWAQGTLAAAHCRAGNTTQAIEILNQLVPAFRAVHFPPAEIFTPYLAEAYWRDGKATMALQTLDEMLAITEPRQMRLQIGMAHRMLGEIRAGEDPAVAINHFERSLTILTDCDAKPELALAYLAYGRLYTQLGRAGEARDCVRRALELFDRMGSAIEQNLRTEFAGLLAG